MKEKRLKPSLRERKRYLAFEVVSNKELAFNVTQSAILLSAESLLGQKDYGKASIDMMMDYWTGKKGILRVNREQLEPTIAALALITEVGSTKAIIRTLGASGMLAKAKKKYIAK